MQNPEFILLRNRFLIALLVALIFTIPLTLLFINKFSNKPSRIIDSINNKESIFILVTENNCEKCQETENIMKENNIDFILLNKDIEEKYDSIIKKIDIPNDELTPPTIIYIKDGIINSKLVNSSQTEIEEFLNFYVSK